MPALSAHGFNQRTTPRRGHSAHPACRTRAARAPSRTRPSQSGPGLPDRGCFGRAREKRGCAATCHPRPAHLGGHGKILEPPSCFTCPPAGACEQGRRGTGRRPAQANTGGAIDGAARFASGARAQARTAAAIAGRTAEVVEHVAWRAHRSKQILPNAVVKVEGGVLPSTARLIIAGKELPAKTKEWGLRGPKRRAQSGRKRPHCAHKMGGEYSREEQADGVRAGRQEGRADGVHSVAQHGCKGD